MARDELTAEERTQWLRHGYNRCFEQAIQALNFLAVYSRPSGGEDAFNSIHLEQIASDMQRTLAALNAKTPAAPPTTPATPVQEVWSSIQRMTGEELVKSVRAAHEINPDGAVRKSLQYEEMSRRCANLTLAEEILADYANGKFSIFLDAFYSAPSDPSQLLNRTEHALRTGLLNEYTEAVKARSDWVNKYPSRNTPDPSEPFLATLRKHRWLSVLAIMEKVRIDYENNYEHHNWFPLLEELTGANPFAPSPLRSVVLMGTRADQADAWVTWYLNRFK